MAAKKKTNGLMSKFSDEQKKGMEARGQKMGITIDQVEKLIELAGAFGPLFYSAIIRLLEILQGQDDAPMVYKTVGECPEELGKALCESEQAALEALAAAMYARHVACCDHEDL